jgi:hypothetical protein
MVQLRARVVVDHNVEMVSNLGVRVVRGEVDLAVLVCPDRHLVQLYEKAGFLEATNGAVAIGDSLVSIDEAGALSVYRTLVSLPNNSVPKHL